MKNENKVQSKRKKTTKEKDTFNLGQGCEYDMREKMKKGKETEEETCI